MNNPVSISNTEWSSVKSDVDNLKSISDRHETRINNHSRKIDEHELILNSMTFNITEAVRKGMDDNDSKITGLNEKIHQMEIDKLKAERDLLEKEKSKEDEEKQWRRRLLVQVTIASAVTAIVSGVVGFYVAAFLNNL